ncbi:hypothetical protein RDI58_012859 [Solanum bulbocastanum]|uniref:F-box domain-containing protein n=1 Tax=Solanum bulbocastanum TaxID=147425 RepID=A0AAN8TL16_SOLBU
MDEEKNRFRDQLGDDIVFEILTWIPAKSLMRFRCVCKDWNALIRQDPNFVIRCVCKDWNALIRQDPNFVIRCVCKDWNALIRQDPNSVKYHIARSHARPSATHISFQLHVLCSKRQSSLLKSVQ